MLYNILYGNKKKLVGRKHFAGMQLIQPRLFIMHTKAMGRLISNKIRPHTGRQNQKEYISSTPPPLLLTLDKENQWQAAIILDKAWQKKYHCLAHERKMTTRKLFEWLSSNGEVESYSGLNK